MSEHFTIVARPNGAPTTRDRVVAAIIDSAGTDGAIRVELNGEPLSKLRSRYRAALWTRGYFLHGRKDGDHAVVLWAEKRTAQ